MKFIYILPYFLLILSPGKCDGEGSDNYRLPKNIVPTHYNLQLVISPEESTFSGIVEITIVATDTINDTLKLHASPNYVKVKTNVLLDYNTACNVTGSDQETEIITITCPENSLDGEHKLILEFDSEISNKEKIGVFQSSYTENGTQEVLISTNFEPVYARRAFPCFDESSFKATFDVFVTRPDVYKVLSNMPEEDSFYVGVGQLQSKFTTTPEMSTYLLAFVISKFDDTVDISSGNYTSSIYTRSSVKSNLKVASKYGPLLVEKLSQWTDISYENLGDKQIDHIIIPDVAVSNVENWGLITYREADLLDEGDFTTQSVKQRIITTIAYELTEQWFADYVTPHWWSDAWLSEGFATYFQYYIPDMIEGDNFELEHQFVINVLQQILRQDSLESSPLSSNETDINSSNDDIKKLDDITYYKGASIVRMIKGMLGEKTFQDGVRLYLKKHRYNSTDVEDLLQEISDDKFATDFAIKTWLYQPGYPVLLAEYDSEGSFVTISQEPFDQSNNSSNSTNEWYIPISYTTSEERDFSIKMKNILVPGKKNRIEHITNTTWLIINLQHHGYYRVTYDDWLWDKIIEALNNDDDRKDIHVLNRAQLLDDIFALAQVGRVTYEKAFKLASYLQFETDYYPWASGLNALTNLGNKLQNNHTFDLLQDTIKGWWINALAKQKNETSNNLTPLKETFFLDWSCKFNLDECIDYAKKSFADFKSNGRIPDYNKRATIFCYGLRNSSNPVEDYQFLLDLYKESTSVDERSDLIIGMGCSLDGTVLSMYLEETMADQSVLRPEEVAAVYRSMYSSGYLGFMAVSSFTFDKAEDIAAKYEGMRVVTSILTGLALRARTEEQMRQLYLIIDYYSDMNDIMLCDRQIGTIEEGTRKFYKQYGKIVESILTPETPTSGSYILRSSCIFTVVSTLVLLYLCQ